MKKVYFFSALLFLSLSIFAQNAFLTKADAKAGIHKSKLTATTPVVQQTRATFFTENFESGTLSGWTTIDNDGDSYNWVNSANLGGQAHTGSYCAQSESWKQSDGALTPDNWLISPAIDLSSAAGTVLLEWYIAAQDQSWPSEHYKVMVSTSGTSITNFTDNVYEETVQAGGPDGYNYWKRTADLSSYNGQTIHVAFVHCNCTDMFRINLDDISVYENSTTDLGVVSFVAPNNNSGCQLTASENVTVKLFNYGGVTVTGFPISYSVNGGTPITETVSASIAPASFYDYTFSQTADLSALDYYTINASINVSGDIDGSNDNYTHYVSSTDANITVEVQSDDQSGQSWEIVNTSGDTIYKHGDYQWNVDSIVTVCVIGNDCYTFNWHGGTSNTVTVFYNGSQVDQTAATGDYSVYAIGGNCPSLDAKLDALTFPAYATPGTNVNVTGTIINIGQNPITSFDVDYTVNGGASVGVYSVTGINIATGNTYNFTHNVPFNETTEATYSIEVTISNVNGGIDADTTNNVLSKSILITSTMMQRKVVLEQFTTENCPNCPPVLQYLEPIVDGDTNIVMITHHSGYYTDSYTTQEDIDFEDFYNDGGSTYAPAGMVDRYYNGQDNDGDGTAEPGPVFWDGDPYGGTAINTRLGEPAFVSVNVGGTYNSSTHQLQVTVYGDFLTDFTGTIGVSLWITEDGLTSTSQAGYSGTWTHRYTCRDAISNEWGDQITSGTNAGNSYSKTFTYTVNASWNYNNLYLVGMVNQIDGSNVNNRKVHNARQVQLNALQPVGNPSLILEDNVQIYPNPTKGEVSLVNVGGKTIEVLNVLGEKLISKDHSNSIEIINLSNFENGTYIIKITTETSVITKRIILNK